MGIEKKIEGGNVILSISIKKLVKDEAEAKVFCDGLKPVLGDEKTVSISAGYFMEIVKPMPIPADKPVEKSK